MNQQRSRRFRAAQEALEKEEARVESVALWECTVAFTPFVVTLLMSLSSHGPSGYSAGSPGRLGHQCYHTWNAVHVPPGCIPQVLGCRENELRRWMEECEFSVI